MSGVGIAPVGMIFLHIVAIYVLLKVISLLLRKPWQKSDEPKDEHGFKPENPEMLAKLQQDAAGGSADTRLNVAPVEADPVLTLPTPMEEPVMPQSAPQMTAPQMTAPQMPVPQMTAPQVAEPHMPPHMQPLLDAALDPSMPWTGTVGPSPMMPGAPLPYQMMQPWSYAPQLPVAEYAQPYPQQQMPAEQPQAYQAQNVHPHSFQSQGFQSQSFQPQPALQSAPQPHGYAHPQAAPYVAAAPGAGLAVMSLDAMMPEAPANAATPAPTSLMVQKPIRRRPGSRVLARDLTQVA